MITYELIAESAEHEWGSDLSIPRSLTDFSGVTLTNSISKSYCTKPNAIVAFRMTKRVQCFPLICHSIVVLMIIDNCRFLISSMEKCRVRGAIMF